MASCSSSSGEGGTPPPTTLPIDTEPSSGIGVFGVLLGIAVCVWIGQNLGAAFLSNRDKRVVRLGTPNWNVPDSQWRTWARTRVVDAIATVCFVAVMAPAAASVPFPAFVVGIVGFFALEVWNWRTLARIRTKKPRQGHDNRGAAWYPDPTGETNLRWWDGTEWTSHTA